MRSIKAAVEEFYQTSLEICKNQDLLEMRELYLQLSVGDFSTVALLAELDLLNLIL